ncbi:MAG: polysaccharide export protein [Bacteroides sp.]|nr:polysaccharide export protein [Bacteroides sp.]
MQEFNNNDIAKVRSQQRLTAQPDDRIAIYVSSKDPSLAEVFNLMTNQRTITTRSSAQSGPGASQSSGGNNNTLTYTVNPQGDIEFPILGKVHIAGLTRQEIADAIQNRLVSQRLLTDAIVTVDFMNATISVLGDVKTPGEYLIDKDNLNIWQAIAKAGDLNITGLRNNVLVVREENGEDRAYRLDLTDTEATMQSPAYYLQQNDIVYVEPNDMKKRQANVNGNNVLSAPFWISTASFVASIAVLISNAIK